MRALVVLALLMVCAALSCCAEGRRVKRRIDEFGEMILLKTSRNPLDFNGYGNFCGFGGSGTPVDAIDRCCQVHDRCYMKLNRAECESLLKYKVYTTQYRWSFRRGDIFCSELDKCKRELCECDRVASTCFGENMHVYDTQNKHTSLINGIAKLVGIDFAKP